MGSVQKAAAEKAGDWETQLLALVLPQESCVSKAMSQQRGPLLSHLRT